MALPASELRKLRASYRKINIDSQQLVLIFTTNGDVCVHKRMLVNYFNRDDGHRKDSDDEDDDTENTTAINLYDHPIELVKLVTDYIYYKKAPWLKTQSNDNLAIIKQIAETLKVDHLIIRINQQLCKRSNANLPKTGRCRRRPPSPPDDQTVQDPSVIITSQLTQLLITDYYTESGELKNNVFRNHRRQMQRMKHHSHQADDVVDLVTTTCEGDGEDGVYSLSSFFYHDGFEW